MPTSSKKHLVVVYHENCIDGLASAWAFDLKWGGVADVHISYIPYGHHNITSSEKDICDELIPGTELFFVDVAPRREFLDRLMSPARENLPPLKSVAVIDHHQSAGHALQNYPSPTTPDAPKLHIQIDAHHPSAANMVWEALLPEREKPRFLQMISKMDLSRDLKDEQDLATAAIIDSKSIRTIAEAFSSFLELAALSQNDMAQMGLSVLSDQKNRIHKLSSNILYIRLPLSPSEEIWVPAINADVQNFGRHISDYLRTQGDRTGMSMAFAWYVQGNGTVTMSIRSDGKPDASEIAALLCRHANVKGGGHKTSAAVHFQSLAQFMELLPLHTEAQMIKSKKTK